MEVVTRTSTNKVNGMNHDGGGTAMMRSDASMSPDAILESNASSHDEIIQSAIEHNRRVREEKAWTNKEFFEAALNGDLAGMEKAVVEGADVTFTTEDGQTALMHAARTGNFEAVEFLLKENAHVPYQSSATSDESRATRFHNTPLHWACFKGHYDIACQLMQHNIDVEDMDAYQNRAIHLASAGGHSNIVEALLSLGVNVHTRNIYGNAPLDVTTDKRCKTLLQEVDAQPNCYACSRLFTQSFKYSMCQKCHKLCCQTGCIEVVSAAVEAHPDARRSIRYCKHCSTELERSEESLKENLSRIEDRLTNQLSMLQVQEKKAKSASTTQSLNMNDIEPLHTSIVSAEEAGVALHTTKEARRTYEMFVAYAQVLMEMKVVDELRPVKTMSSMTRLKSAIVQGSRAGVTEVALEEARKLIRSAESECYLSGVFALCETIACATRQHSQQMKKLTLGISLADSRGGDQALIAKSRKLLDRFTNEIELQDALAVPAMKSNDAEPPTISYVFSDGTVVYTLLQCLETRVENLVHIHEKNESLQAFDQESMDKVNALLKQLKKELKEEMKNEEERKRLEEEAAAKAAKKPKKKAKK